MRVMELKATLYRANPAVIRQFTVPEDMTAGELGKAMRLLLGFKASVSWRMWNRDREFTEETPLEEIFAAKNIFYCSAQKKKEAGYPMTFRIMLLGRKEQEEEYPKVIRFRGMNPPEDIKEISEFNKLQSIWRAENYYYGYQSEKYKQADYEFVPQEADWMLKKAFAGNPAQAGILMELDYRNTCKINEILELDTVQEMKETAGKAGIHLPTNLRKKELADALIQELRKPETLDRVLRNLSLGQYHAFQEMCIGNTEWKNEPAFIFTYNTFVDCDYMCFNGYGGYTEWDWPHGSVVCSRELLQAYEDWLEGGKEEAYLKRAELISSIRGCVELYGYIERGEWKRLAANWTDGAWTDKELEILWQSYRDYLLKSEDSEIVNYRSEAFYAGEIMDEKTLRSLLSSQAATPRYVPSFEEVKKIEENGLRYEGQAQKELDIFLKKKCRMDEENAAMANGELYRLLHCGVSFDECVRIFQQAAHIRDKNLLKELKALLSRLEPLTRKIDTGGYTETELAATRKDSGGTTRRMGKKVYPNDPCPCGSGKKYKNCCGRQER